ncbi:MAG: hypothetical protein ACI9KE_003293 [Polyangiales bacterium]
MPQDALWRTAQEAFVGGNVGAHSLWEAIEPESPEGREAKRRLNAADQHYRLGIARLERGEEGARADLAAGVAIAPINPALYLPLARACAAQGLTLRAAEYYTKYLTAFPESDSAEAARDELSELDPRLAGVFQTNPIAPEEAHESATPWGTLFAGALFGMALTLVFGVLYRWFGGRGMRLAQLVDKSPEFHPSVAYLVGSLRHEFLKHRIGAAADSLRENKDTDRVFLRERLYGGQPLRGAWEGHLLAFEGALGHRVDLRRDPWFRRADRAVRTIARLEDAISSGSKRAMNRLTRAHRTLMELDAHLASMIGDLARTLVDETLMEEVVLAVRSEHGAGAIELDRLEIEAPRPREESEEGAVLLDVFRVDLVLILKNILRNAVLAVGAEEQPRHIRFAVAVMMEDTGEETVTFEVHDSSNETFDPEILFDRRIDRGLGLVAAAVHRYGGTIDVVSSEQPFAKRVVVSFFRAD